MDKSSTTTMGSSQLATRYDAETLTTPLSHKESFLITEKSNILNLIKYI
jgi:hypothetical protein